MRPVTAAEATGIRWGTPMARGVLWTTILGSGMAMLDGSVVNVALPRIGEELQASVAGLQWILDGYLLALAALILVAGSLGDRYGRRRVYLVGVVWFGVASGLCAAATSTEMLVAFRILQGIGGALLTPARWRSCSPRSRTTTGPARSARGPGSAASPRRSARWSAACWYRSGRGGWRS